MANPDSAQKGFRYLRREGGTGAAPLVPRTLDSNVGCSTGDLIKVSADGVCDPVESSDTSDGLVLAGVAAHGVTAASGTQQEVLCYPCDQDNVFVVQKQDASATNVGGAFPIAVDSNGYYELATATASDDIVRVVGKYDEEGYTNDWGTDTDVLVKFTETDGAVIL